MTAKTSRQTVNNVVRVALGSSENKAEGFGVDAGSICWALTLMGTAISSTHRVSERKSLEDRVVRMMTNQAPTVTSQTVDRFAKPNQRI